MDQKQNPHQNIVLLTGDNLYTPIIYNYLKDTFNISCVVVENSSPKLKIIKKRIKRFGLLRVLGQILFRILVIPLLEQFSKKRICQIKENYGMEEQPVDPSKIMKVTSLNDEELVSMLKETRPDLIVVAYATGIISADTLKQAPSKFINMHGGINPLYRGVHGAYWALVERNFDACGVTIHYIDSGIDTGKILAQGTVDISKNDNIYTYPLLLLARGIPLLKSSIQSILGESVDFPEPPKGESRYWSHPTLWEYLCHWITKGVK